MDACCRGTSDHALAVTNATSLYYPKLDVFHRPTLRLSFCWFLNFRTFHRAPSTDKANSASVSKVKAYNIGYPENTQVDAVTEQNFSILLNKILWPLHKCQGQCHDWCNIFYKALGKIVKNQVSIEGEQTASLFHESQIPHRTVHRGLLMTLLQ